MARDDRSERDAPEPLARLLDRSDAVIRELERARRHLADLEERLGSDEPREESASGGIADDGSETPGSDEASHPSDEDEPAPPVEDVALRRVTSDDVVVVPDPASGGEPDEGPSRDRDVTLLQEAARRRLSDER